ncbi:MAG: thioredoxin family protein [Chitinophagales bacterium]|nr:thioredoxin family protein [Chitinophagaceae bacterium]MCB9064726.1 thioredoxin family protein [Chitinophagales bacterium]
MNRFLKLLPLALVTVFLSLGAKAQMLEDPTEWTVTAKQVEGNKYDIVFHCHVNNGWHVYALDPGGDGSFIPPSFTINESPDIKLVGEVREEGEVIDEFIDDDIGTVHYFKDVDFIQTVELAKEDMNVAGEYGYMTCNDETCLPPKYVEFSVQIGKGGASGEKKNDEAVASEVGKKDGEGKSLLVIFLLAFVGGILAVLTPCVFSMIPITVSFFTKRSATRAEGIKNALWYSASIIIIFTVLGVAISAIFGADALNVLSTHWIPNMIFFIIFIIFGISFLGAFELTLPSSWMSKTDAKANTKSLSGIFFMALTLVIVSFSCTGPIIGPLIVGAAMGGFQGPILGMLGFSIGLALPFALFAIFPGMLNNLAKSGGWLNQVKVTLGFIELMLALKFLSNADLQQGWRLLDREIFIAIWIVLAVMLGVYLLGKLKLGHDDANAKNLYGQEYVSIFKLFLSIVCFSFAVYMLPGMWGAPLKGLSAFVPPMGTQDFVIGQGGGAGGGHMSASGEGPERYVSEMKIYEPEAAVKYGLITYYDYNEALEASHREGKPIMLDFTGINCINCRKMEGQVWSDPNVMKRMKDDFIVASLYCDAQNVKIPADEQYDSEYLKKKVTTLGQRNSDLQASKYGSNAQPFYFFIDEDENKLIEGGYGYDPDVQAFIDHLDKVKENYNNR